MGKKVSLLIDTNIFVDYFRLRLFRKLLTSDQFQIFYSAVTKKELLTKPGLSHAEEKSIRKLLKRFRIIPLDQQILDKYSELRKRHPTLEKEDCLIAATAIASNIQLVTHNYKHFRPIKELVLYFSSPRKP